MVGSSGGWRRKYQRRDTDCNSKAAF
jgi:hypothetical protein